MTLRRSRITKVVTLKSFEEFIKDLLDSPETLHKSSFITHLQLSVNGIDGPKLRQDILDWLAIKTSKRAINGKTIK